MKLFKGSKKNVKDGEKKLKSRSLFGSRKKSGSKKQLTQKNMQIPRDADSFSFSSQTDTATTMSPQWLNGSGNGSGNGTSTSHSHSDSNALLYHEQALGGGDQSHTDPFSCGDEEVGGGSRISISKTNTSDCYNMNKASDESESNICNANSSGLSPSAAAAGPKESDIDIHIGEMESSADVLKNILTYLTEKECKEWADGLEDSQKEDNAVQKDDLDGLLRQTVDRMDIEPQDVEVQRLGTQIVYHLSKIQHKASTRTDFNHKADDCWYATEKGTSRGCDSNGNSDDDDDEELITDAVEAILQAMEDFPDDEVLIENACLALEESSRKRNVNNSNSAKCILEEVLMAIEGFADNPIVVSSSLTILYNLSSSSNTNTNTTNAKNKENSNDDLRRRFAKYVLPSILHGMKEHRDDLELYTKGCKAMANFTKDDPNGQQILACKEALGLRIISEGLKYWDVNNLDEFAMAQCLRLRLAAIRVLKNLSTHPSLEVKGKIALGGGAARIIDRLLEALVFTGKDLIDNNYHVGEFSANANEEDQVDEEDEVGISLAIMRGAFQTIENLADIESVVTKDDPRSPHMPTLYRSVAMDNSSAEDIQRQLAKAVKPVLNTIRQHPDRQSVQYHGLNCVRQLTISHADSIANHGGISTFLNVLSSPGVAAVNDSMIHERALSCLTGLLSPSSNANGLDLVASMETEDGLDAIFRTIRRYQSNTAVIETSYESLFYLSCRVRVVLASIVGCHPSIACGVGAKAARRLQSQLCLEENVFVMLGTLNQYFESSESISQRGLGLLVNVHAFLTQEQQQRHQQPDILASDGGIRLVLAVMRRHGLAVAIQEYGVGLLSGILKSAISSHAIRREFVDEEGISTVLAAMMIHPDHAAVQSHGCDVLIQLMAIDKHPMENGYSETATFAAYYKKCILEETNAVAVVQDSMERFRTNKGVQHFGSALLQELSTTTAVTPLSALPSKAASISTKLQSSIFSSTSMISSSIRSSLE
jgi:hypothetical protein